MSRGLWPLIPALDRHKQIDLCKFETSLVYTEFQSSQGLHSETTSKREGKKKKKEEEEGDGREGEREGRWGGGRGRARMKRKEY